MSDFSSLVAEESSQKIFFVAKKRGLTICYVTADLIHCHHPFSSQLAGMEAGRANILMKMKMA